MSFSSGTFSLVAGNPVTTGTTISSTWANNTLSDIATGLSSCMLKDGTQTITANIPMGGFKFTGLSAGTATGDSVRWQQVFTTGTLSLLGALYVQDSLGVGGSISASASLFVGGNVSTSGALNLNKAATLTATSTVAIGAATGNYAVITGTATVSSFDSLRAGSMRVIEWSGATPLNNNANLVVQGATNLTTAAGDVSQAISEGAGTWRLFHQKVSGAPVSMSPIANSIAANVLLTNTGTYFDGPVVAQGTAGTWFFSGTITVSDSAGAAAFNVRLTDGTTIIASARCQINTAGAPFTCALSGFLASPAASVKIQVQDVTSTSGVILANTSSNAVDSTLTGIRIG